MSIVKITAEIPAGIVRGYRYGTHRPIQARTIEFRRDEEGRWTAKENGLSFPISRSDVIATCKRAKNWPEIMREHFRFHS